MNSDIGTYQICQFKKLERTKFVAASQEMSPPIYRETRSAAIRRHEETQVMIAKNHAGDLAQALMGLGRQRKRGLRRTRLTAGETAINNLCYNCW
jgi:predicted secreted Zn-dependent protease